MFTEYHEKQIRKIQKRLSGPKLNIEAAVEKFEELPELHRHANAYLDAILREKYEHQHFDDLGHVLHFLRGLLHINPEFTLHGCWVLHQVDSHLGTSFHRHHSLALPFFIYELTGKLIGTPFKPRVDQFWLEWFAPSVQGIVLSQNVHLESVARHETLYAAADDLKFDVHRRSVFTWNEPWVPKPEEREAQWRLIPGNDAKSWFYLANAKYPVEYLFASDTHHSGGGGHFAFTLCDGHQSTERQAEVRWELQAFGRDVFALYNPRHRVFLYAAVEMRDSQRRFVLTLHPDEAAPHVNEDRKWRFRACIQ